MKKLFYTGSMLCQVSLIVTLVNIHIASGQAGKEKHFPIPDDINKIFQTSCMPCHGEKGGRLPGARLNFSRWAGYGAVREAEKASAICSSVRRGTMPPRSVRESKPDLILKKEQVDLVCKWAESLKSEKREK